MRKTPLTVIRGANIGDACAVFEAVHGSAHLLDHVDQQDKAERLRQAVLTAIGEHDRVTPDLGGDGRTDDFSHAVMERL